MIGVWRVTIGPDDRGETVRYVMGAVSADDARTRARLLFRCPDRSITDVTELRIMCNGNGPLTPGVVSGSHMGHYVGRDAVLTALDMGMDDSEARDAADTYEDESDSEKWSYFDAWPDIVDDSVRWLNDHTTGGVWWFFDGDFRLDAPDDYDEYA